MKDIYLGVTRLLSRTDQHQMEEYEAKDMIEERVMRFCRVVRMSPLNFED